VRRAAAGSDLGAARWLRNRSWWKGKEAFVVDDYELVATSQGNPLDPLVPLLAQAVDIGLHLVIARRTGGAGRMYDNLVTAPRVLAQPGLLLSGDPSEGAPVGQLRAVPAVPGRARMLTRDGYNLV
jgi:S-DNA-T family DNA segregation ATPase FtsK/SpoIIIE